MTRHLPHFAITLAISLAPALASAQAPPQRPRTIVPNLQLSIDPLGISKSSDQSNSSVPRCDFNLFADLRNETLHQYLTACASKLANDSKAALDDATAKADQTAINCLKPGTDLLAAGVPTKDANGVEQDAGILLMFQKFRDFILAGGKEACKAWVNTTVAGAVTP